MSKADEVQCASETVTGLVGEVLDLLGVGGWQVTLTLGDQRVRFEQAIDVEGQDAALPATLGGLALLLPLLHQEVTAASVQDRGRLVLTFGDVTLGCSPHEQYEAWNYAGPDGAAIVCQPGGGLAIWGSG